MFCQSVSNPCLTLFWQKVTTLVKAWAHCMELSHWSARLSLAGQSRAAQSNSSVRITRSTCVELEINLSRFVGHGWPKWEENAWSFMKPAWSFVGFEIHMTCVFWAFWWNSGQEATRRCRWSCKSLNNPSAKQLHRTSKHWKALEWQKQSIDLWFDIFQSQKHPITSWFA